MASETSRSGGSADSYIGSLISLTSKSEIRYEGILYQINTEEASIGLRSVRSFGTEGRRKDGPQIPPIDRVYEYIVFRGSDIKDLQVKSSPPAPSSQPVHNDPAIIQSHYSQAAATSSLSPVNNVSPSDLSAPMLPQSGPPRPSLQSNLPLYQPVGPLTWGGPASVAPSAVNSTGPSMPLYWQGYYGPSSVLQGQPPPQSLMQPPQSLMQPPQSLMQPPQSLMIPPSSQQSVSSVSNPSMNLPVSSSVSPSPDFQPSFGSLGSSVLNMQPTMFPGQGPSVMSESSASQLASKSAAQTAQGPSAASQIANLPLGSAVPHMMDKNAISAMPSHGNLISGPMISSLSGFSEHLSAAAVVGTSSSPPSLVTPGQFLQPGPTSIFPLSHPVQTAQKDVEVAPVSSLSLPMHDAVTSAPLSASASASESASGSVSVPTSAPSETQAPLLPLPSPSNSKFNRGPGYMRHNNHRGGRRGSELLHSATSYTEEFDFEAMNEKFKKDEVWGHLGKSKANEEDDEDIQYEDDIEFPKVDVKPVYNKDDFFDSLSSNNIDGGSRGGRPRFSEQMRLDTETFGSFSRYRGGRGGRGLGRGGRYRGGGYYGRGYGYVGRGRGGYGAYRAM